MRHKAKRLQLNRFTSWRKATLKSMARNVLIYQSIKTTLDKAKAASPLVEKLISLAKKNTLSAKREAFSILGDHNLVVALFNDIGERFKDRNSGFTRIIQMGRRRGDDASLAILELTEIKKIEKKKIKKESSKEEQKTAEEKTAPEKEKKTETQVAVKEKPPITKKPSKKFLGGIRNIFKKERDSL